MRFEKFGSVLNIIFGVIFLITGLAIGGIGIAAHFNEFETILKWLPEETQKMIADKGLNTFAAIEEFIKTNLEGTKDVPEAFMQLLNYGLTNVLMGVGFGLAVYTIIFNISLTSVVLKKIGDANNGIGSEPRLLAIVVGFFSLIPVVFTGVLMLLGAFGSAKQQPQLRRVQPQPQQRRGY